MGGRPRLTPQKTWCETDTRGHTASRFYTQTHKHTHVSLQKQGSTYTTQHALPPRDTLNHLTCQSETKHTHGNMFNVKEHNTLKDVAQRGLPAEAFSGGFQQKVRHSYGQRNRHLLLCSCR